MPDPLAVVLALPGVVVAAYLVGRGLWRRLRPPPAMDLTQASVIDLPFASGSWQAFNSPASKVPSHGTDWLGQRYAIDLVGVDSRGEHALEDDWRSKLWLEPPERFHAFGALLVAPGPGTVVSVYDQAPDRLACRSWVGLGWFVLRSFALGALAAYRRSPAGLAAVAGNHVVLQLDDGWYAALMHLQRGFALVRSGERLGERQPVGRVGNSGKHHAAARSPAAHEWRESEVCTRSAHGFRSL